MPFHVKGHQEVWLSDGNKILKEQDPNFLTSSARNDCICHVYHLSNRKAVFNELF